jgi:hypothetical protein
MDLGLSGLVGSGSETESNLYDVKNYEQLDI